MGDGIASALDITVTSPFTHEKSCKQSQCNKGHLHLGAIERPLILLSPLTIQV